MHFRNPSPVLAGFIISLAALVACSGPGAGDGATPDAPQPTPTVAVETPQSTVTPAPTETPPPASPTATPAEIADPLADSNWLLVSLGPAGEEATVLVESEVTLQFDDAGQAGGSGGCNAYGGAYDIQDDALSFGPIASTMMACAGDALMDQEQRYLAALQNASTFTLSEDGQQLTVWYDDGQGALNFTPLATQPDAGSGQSEAIYLDRLTFTDATNGWAIGRLDELSGEQLLVTIDGGATWQRAMPPEIDGNDARPPIDRAALYAASPQQAWAAFASPANDAEPVPSHVWLTADGGQTWRATEPLQLDDLPYEYFAPRALASGDGQHGWLLAHLGAGMSHDYIAIFTTADGGETWQRVADPENNPDLQPCNKSGLVFTDAQEGWLAGDCPGLMPPLFLFHTTDGGANWTQIELPPPAPEIVVSGDQCGIPRLAPIPDRSLALTLRCIDFEEEQSQAWLYTTTDNGQSWQAQSLPEAAGIFTFLNSNEGWYLAANESQPDEDSRVYHTTDGGATWTTLQQLDGQGQPFLHFANAQQGWALVGYPPDRTLYHTTDAGATWQPLDPTVTLP